MTTIRISTIEELEREQKKLRMGMKVTKDAFSKSLGTNRKCLKDFLLTKVAIPAGVAGAGLYAFNKLSKDEEPEKVVVERKGILAEFLPLALEAFQIYLIKKQQNDIDQLANETQVVVETDDTIPPDNYYRSTLQSAS